MSTARSSAKSRATFSALTAAMVRIRFITPTNLHHWFDGDGMIHSIYFENGKAEYRNAFIRTDDYKAELAGTLDAGGVLLPANPGARRACL